MISLVFAILAVLAFALALLGASVNIDLVTLGLLFLAAWCLVRSLPLARDRVRG